VNALIAALFASALVFIQCYIGGTRLAYALPAYSLIAMAGLLCLFIKTKGDPKPSKSCVFITVLFSSYILWRALTSPNEYLARTDFFMVLACVVSYGIIAFFITQRTLRMAVLSCMLLLAVVETLIAARQFATGDGWLPFGLLRYTGERASGTFISSISLAGFLEIVAPFALGIAFWGSRTTWLRLFAGYIALTSYFAITMTGSRGGWISSVISLVVFLVLSMDLIRRTNPRKLPAAIYTSVIGILLLGAAVYFGMSQSAMISSRMEQLGDVVEKDIYTYDVRTQLWLSAIDQWHSAPAVGTGAGTFLYYGRLYRKPGLLGDPVHAHSDYLELLGEYGTVGGIALGLFLIVHISAGINTYRRLAKYRAAHPYETSYPLAFNLGALCAVAAYLAHSLIDFNMHIPGNALFFATIFAIIANPGKPDERHESDDESTPRKPEFISIFARIVVPAMAAWLLYVGLSKLSAETSAERARIALREKRYEDAVFHAKTGLQNEKGNPYLYGYLGQAYRLLGALENPEKDNLVNAADAFRAALKLFPQDTELNIRLGQTLDKLGEYGEARKAYQTAIQNDPNSGVPYAHYARHLALVGRYEEAEMAVRRSYLPNPKEHQRLIDEVRNPQR
jgi:O-antigen ligase